MQNDFRARLRGREKLLGTIVTLSSPAAAEILADAGFDWLFVDGEHGPLETGDIMGILQAVGDKAACIVRVPTADETPIKRVLDLGADGIIAPLVNTAEQAEYIVRSARYSPAGSRGVGLGRAHGYGMRFKEYIDSANELVTVVVQAEHAQAVENIESIVKVEGIDAVLIGPYDLSASMGKMGQVDDPAVIEAIDHVTDTCLAAGIPLGYFGVNAEAVRPFADRGYTLLVAGTDTLFLGSAAEATLSALR
ncbi:MAG: aldolase/citrate lyase family protein [Planctomycetota bacterium]|jgi:2-dehydro-3-deoxyglucarate aldolase/4-hydroxy-2-oxoheptanedioate aldolase|nr:aldolase/citrate lyase family protein [Planctomycetota bacterium]MDP6502923.1 aldolase/citrate lyase family protein [Planctomycetota bacterium]